MCFCFLLCLFLLCVFCVFVCLFVLFCFVCGIFYFGVVRFLYLFKVLAGLGLFFGLRIDPATRVDYSEFDRRRACSLFVSLDCASCPMAPRTLVPGVCSGSFASFVHIVKDLPAAWSWATKTGLSIPRSICSGTSLHGRPGITKEPTDSQNIPGPLGERRRCSTSSEGL